MSTERFDAAAGTWDLAERRVALARDVAAAMAASLPLSKDLSVLDFGCGTGLVTLALAPQVGAIAGADSSGGMLATLAEKAAAQGLPVRQVALGPDGSGDLGGPYDLIASSMTLHHVADVPALLRRFQSHLAPGGRLALADLDSEDGSFHEDATGVYHQGFARETVQGWLEAAGYQDVCLLEAARTGKAGRIYTIFLALATKG